MKTEELKEFILKNFGKKKFHGYKVYQTLEEMGVQISTTRLYKVLDEMMSEGLLKDNWIKSRAGPKKRVYELTELGQQERNTILEKAIATVHEFYLEYLDNFPEEENRTLKICKLLSNHVPSNGTIGSLVYDFSASITYFLGVLHKTTPLIKKYMIVAGDSLLTEYEGWMILEGKCNDIPLRKESLDLLLLPGLREQFCERIAVEECARVLKPTGTLAFLTPAALLRNSEEVLTIGEFVEFLMHAKIEGNIPLTLHSLKKQLEYCFQSVEIKEFGDLTLALATDKKTQI